VCSTTRSAYTLLVFLQMCKVAYKQKREDEGSERVLACVFNRILATRGVATSSNTKVSGHRKVQWLNQNTWEKKKDTSKSMIIYKETASRSYCDVKYECVRNKAFIGTVGDLPILSAGTSQHRATRRKYKLFCMFLSIFQRLGGEWVMDEGDEEGKNNIEPEKPEKSLDLRRT